MVSYSWSVQYDGAVSAENLILIDHRRIVCESRHSPYDALFVYKGENMTRKELYIARTEQKSQELERFNKLCDRSKEIILNALNFDCCCCYFYTWEIDEDLISSSPIEQIFYISCGLYELGNIENDFRLDIGRQRYIQAKNKTYRCDFIIETVVQGNEEKFLKKPLIIELDGYDYHSSKKQISYDYERENQLKLCGYDVMRFTGSQVYNHPMRCIEKVYEYCKKAEFEEE